MSTVKGALLRLVVTVARMGRTWYHLGSRLPGGWVGGFRV